MLWLLTVACLREPVLVGVEESEPTGESVRRDETAPYEKDPGVQVDCVHLTGKPFDAARHAIAQQLGDIVAVEDLGDDGRLLRLQRGEVRELAGLAYQPRFAFAAPLRRGDALLAAGLRSQIDRWYGTHREWLVRWTQGFARLRLGKHAGDPELVEWVECTRWFPKDDRRR